MKTRLMVFTKYLIDILFIFGCILTIFVPRLAKIYSRVYPQLRSHYYLLLCLFMGAGFFCLLIVWELHRVFKTLMASTPFIRENEVSLKKMGYFCFCITVLLFPFVLVIFRAAVIIMVFIFILAGLFCFVLSQLFKQAVNYKEENDLTI